jgi:hypothetical protein
MDLHPIFWGRCLGATSSDLSATGANRKPAVQINNLHANRKPAVQINNLHFLGPILRTCPLVIYPLTFVTSHPRLLGS